MSLDYRFSIATELDAQRVLKMALAELGLTPETALTEEGAFKETHGPGFLASAGPTAVMQRMILKEGLEIDPTADIHFSVDKFSERALAVTSMLRSVLVVLRQLPGDAVLLFTGETVLLCRKDGRLWLDESTGLWTPARRALVEMPYEMKSFPPI